MSIRGCESYHSSLSQPANSLLNSPIKEGIMKYGKHRGIQFMIIRNQIQTNGCNAVNFK